MPVKAPPAPPPETIDWGGFYLGGHAGYGWGTKDWSVITTGPIAGFAVNNDISGGLAGAHGGFNYQWSRYVLGIEGQWSWTNVRGTHVGSVLGFTNTLGADVDWLAMLTGRLGYAADRWLIFASGGAVWARDKYSANFGAFPALQFEADVTRLGWTVGGGVEYALTRNWSLRLDYNYIDISSDRGGGGGGGTTRLTVVPVPVPPPGPPDGVDSRIDQTMHVIKAGVTYRFR